MLYGVEAVNLASKYLFFSHFTYSNTFLITLHKVLHKFPYLNNLQQSMSL